MILLGLQDEIAIAMRQVYCHGYEIASLMRLPHLLTQARNDTSVFFNYRGDGLSPGDIPPAEAGGMFLQVLLFNFLIYLSSTFIQIGIQNISTGWMPCI